MASIRWKILLAFFLIVGLSFFVAATTLTGMVSTYLFEQRKRDDSMKTEKLAQKAEPLFQSVSVNELNDLLEENAATMDGRLLLIDNDGKIQYDTFQALCGQRIAVDEAIRVLTGEKKQDTGIHAPGRAVAEAMSGESDTDYVAYSACQMTGYQGQIGTVLFVSRVKSLMDSLDKVRVQLLQVFVRRPLELFPFFFREELLPIPNNIISKCEKVLVVIEYHMLINAYSSILLLATFVSVLANDDIG